MDKREFTKETGTQPKTLLCVTLSGTKGLELQENTEILRFAQNDKNCEMGFWIVSKETTK